MEDEGWRVRDWRVPSARLLRRAHLVLREALHEDAALRVLPYAQQG